VNIIKVRTVFPDVEPEVLYDVLHDHYYRRTWDDHMIEGSIVEQVDPTNEVGYYSCKMPFPLANRDYCNHRSWRVFPETKTWVIFNKSVIHPGCPERAVSPVPSSSPFFFAANTHTWCICAEIHAWVVVLERIHDAETRSGWD